MFSEDLQKENRRSARGLRPALLSAFTTALFLETKEPTCLCACAVESGVILGAGGLPQRFDV